MALRRSFLGLGLVLGWALLAGIVGCQPADEPAAVVLPDLAECASAWQVIHQLGIQTGGSEALPLRGGELYLVVRDPNQIVAVPLAGGDPRVVADVQYAEKLWIDAGSDSLTYAPLDDKFWQVPLAGGTPVLVANGQTAFVAPSYSVPADLALDGTSYYWDLSPQIGAPEWTVWWMPRAGGPAEKLATLPVPAPTNAWRTITPAPDALLVAAGGDAPAAYWLPLDRSPARRLPALPTAPSRGSSFIAGAGPAGVMWTTEVDVPSARWPTSWMSFSDARSASPAPAPRFWMDKPPAMRPGPTGTWPDGAGAWIVTGTEWFADEAPHDSVWAVDAGGNGRRLGCNPSIDSGFVSSIAVAEDAVYLEVGDGGQSVYFDYSLIKLAR